MKPQKRLAFGILTILVLLSPLAQEVVTPVQNIDKSPQIDVLVKYAMTGWMGDGKDGRKFIQLKQNFENEGKRRSRIAKITYKIGPEGWAGGAWLYKPNNWIKGADFGSQGFKRVRFLAKGEKGGEVVKFTAGGESDSFEVTTGDIELERDWKAYEIKLDDENLSKVIMLFSWFATEDSNPNGLTFYLRDVRYL